MRPEPGRGVSLSLALKALTLLLGLVGQVLPFARSGFRSGAQMLYYTNITNVLIILLMAALLYHALRARKAGGQALLPDWLNLARFALTAGILLTFVGFTLLLLPRMGPAYLMSAENLLVHYLVPLLAGLDYTLYARPMAGRPPRAWQGLLVPFLYAVYVTALSFLGLRFHQGATAPYFFLDAAQNGWLGAGQGRLGVFWWLLIIAALQLALSRLLLGLNKSLRQAG